MSYRLQTDESLPAGMTRIVYEQLDQAIGALSHAEQDVHESIHETRKSLKKVRAVLRLMRGELGKMYKTENTRFRDAGRKLSDLRDAEARIETLDQMRDVFGDALKPERFGALRADLVRHRETTFGSVDVDQRIAEALEMIRVGRNQVETWPLKRSSFKAIRPGLTRIYRQGRDAFALAYAEPTVEHFHDWRKRVKDHWYHVRLLRNIWPDVMKSYEDELDHLGDLLGDDHDLAIFRETLLTEENNVNGGDATHALQGLIAQRQTELRTEAATLGRRIFAERPNKGFATRIQHYYKAWTAEMEQPAVLADAVGV
jgi:CHAD domain-containing protein